MTRSGHRPPGSALREIEPATACYQRQLMIVVVDILQALDAYGSLERVVLANTLGCAPTELDSPLALGVQRGLIGVGAQGWAEDPGSFVGSYAITEAGRKLYSHVLDRFAQQVAGPPGLSIAERFLYMRAATSGRPPRRASWWHSLMTSVCR